MNDFIIKSPSIDAYFRGIILFGANTASYKFALAKALIDLTKQNKDFVSERDLALVFLNYMNEHIQNGTPQITSNSSKYFDAFASYNKQHVSLDEMVSLTLSNPFKNVIDRFHTINSQQSPTTFYERTQKNGIKGIVITDNIFKLQEMNHLENIIEEIEGRWRLVEVAWSLKMNPSLLNVKYDVSNKSLFIAGNNSYKRIDITSSRSALNGYQKGKCFYCVRDISINKHHPELTDVDHFIPHLLQPSLNHNLDGVWNLVLSCTTCNRGENGKFTLLPILEYLEKLYERNEYFIMSHHPLRETLINQLGKNSYQRKQFLNEVYNLALTQLLFTWKPTETFIMK
ncbi:hypothetical protein HMPREF1210_00145 [Paenisporosarcina sp. HGH0030]|uniref:HNH endonuclease domain-containing protein n=1 Tax=Paenisporosarcina sp. HGH0030 TaxID=1078085 RepID=UPI00034EB2C2|nr:HNH endonuclease domain-containing protein [Paenisporosarcina sp. HGH0030]EPD54160.1 hypothetical protein HMPREF1210_00145 [Paenisporosarcina sp. HGH0030]